MRKNIYYKAVLFITLLSFHSLSSCVNTIQKASAVHPIKQSTINKSLDGYDIENTTMSNSNRIKNVCCALMTGCITTSMVMFLMYLLGYIIYAGIKYSSNRWSSYGIINDYDILSTSMPFIGTNSGNSIALHKPM